MMVSSAKLFFSIAVVMAVSSCSVYTQVPEAPIKQVEVDSFAPVVADVASLNEKYGAENVLIVVDIDNTLLTSSVDLGGDIWYQWQRGKLDIKPKESQKVDCLFQDSIGLLYELVPMNLTEENLPDVISQWQANNNTLFALTSRAPKYRAATERELANKGIDLELTALAPKGKQPPVYRETLERELSYMKGIMMTTGMNKGEMLDYILKKTGRSYDAFVFVDDSEKNIVNVYEAYKERDNIDRNIYHYVRIEKSRETKYGQVLTAAQATKMANDWRELNTTLNTLFPQRNLSEGCLSPN